MPAFLFSVLSLAIALAPADKPPTLDPTYGMKPPRPSARPAKSAEPLPQWIWAAQNSDGQRVLAHKAFTLSRVPRSAIIYLTADDFFTLYVNGRKIDESRPDPKDTFVWKQVHHQDITSLLRAGENVIEIVGTNAGGAAGIIARLEADGKTVTQTDETWQVQELPAAPVGEANAPLPAFAPAEAKSATIVAPLNGGPWAGVGGLNGWPGYDAAPPYLAHLPIRPVGVTPVSGSDNYFTGIESATRQRGSVRLVVSPSTPTMPARELVLDFGKELSGRIALQSENAGTVLVGTGESREEAVKSPWGGVHRLDLAPGRAAYTPYSAFRYAHLVFSPSASSPTSNTEHPTPLVLTRAEADHLYYPVTYKGRFDCSDPLLTKIWYTGAYTAHLCMQDDIWDAPKRDRARWIGDLHVSGAVINLAFADRFLMEQTLQRLRDDAQGGKPAAALPQSNVNGIPGYSCAWICTLADFHRHIGDHDFLMRQHDALISLLDYLRGELDERGVFVNKHGQWPFVDWAPEFNGAHPLALTATHLFLVKAVDEAMFLLREMNDSSSADRYTRWQQELAETARKYLRDPATGTYGDRRQANAMAIYSGVAGEQDAQKIYDTILRPGTPAWNYVATPYYNNYVIYALSQSGHTQSALDFIRTYWGGMLDEGATSWWEGYDPKWDKNDFHAHLQADDGTGYFVSLAHGWSAGPTSFLTERVLGVSPKTGGFRQVAIAPELGDLTWAEGDIPTPQGTLKMRVERSGADMRVKMTVPSGVVVNLTLPKSSPGVLVNGKFERPLPFPSGKQTLILSGGQRYDIR